MRFTYTYRSSDGARHAAEIEAESRDAAFAAIRREMGVKPIKVVAAEAAGVQAGAAALVAATSGGRASSRAALWIAAILAAVILAAVAGGAWWWAVRTGGRGQPPSQFTVDTPQGPVTYRIADPLPRQSIPGNRQRIEDGQGTLFTNAAERFLSRFAEPGRAVALSGERPSEAEFAACLRKPIHVASTDFTEVSDLKRIVAGLKREMMAYLAGGGTVEQYLAELERRQRLEVSYRENAERRLKELLNDRDKRGSSRDGRNSRGPSRDEAQQSYKEAYDYWLKANAQLQAMGIYPLALPDALRSYQMSLAIDE